MVRCLLCGKDATGAFIHGYAPAPDSQKVGLCAEHNTLENKKKAILYWIRDQKAQISRHNQLVQLQATPPKRFELSIHYRDGGVVKERCLEWNVTDGSTLQVTRLDKTLAFIPLQHVKRFNVRELEPQTTVPLANRESKD